MQKAAVFWRQGRLILLHHHSSIFVSSPQYKCFYFSLHYLFHVFLNSPMEREVYTVSAQPPKICTRFWTLPILFLGSCFIRGGGGLVIGLCPNSPDFSRYIHNGKTNILCFHRLAMTKCSQWAFQEEKGREKTLQTELEDKYRYIRWKVQKLKS